MSVADALSFSDFMRRYRPPMPPVHRSDPLALARQITERYREGEAFTEQERSSCSRFFLCHFRGGSQRLLSDAAADLLTACPRLLTRETPRALLAALCLDPQFSTPRLQALLAGLEDPAIVLLPVGAPWTGPKGLLRRWDSLPEGLYPAVDRNRPLPDQRPTNSYIGLMPAGAEEPLYSLDPEADLEAILEETLLRCTVIGQVSAETLSTLGALCAARLDRTGLLAALAPGGLLAGEAPAALAAFARSDRCPPERRALLLSHAAF